MRTEPHSPKAKITYVKQYSLRTSESAHKETATVRERTEIGRPRHTRTEGEPYCEAHNTHEKP